MITAKPLDARRVTVQLLGGRGSTVATSWQVMETVSCSMLAGGFR
ncbi:hypothetical protein [Pseudomonas sp. Leaf58]|nr:hypothetical protein [Pseudomonas sp. Leaf58]